MESPFSNHNTIVFYLEPVLNPIHKSYQQIITLDAIPQGPLSDMVSPISVPKLSTFKVSILSLLRKVVFMPY